MRVSSVRLTLALVVSLLGVAAYGCAQHVGGDDGDGGRSSSAAGDEAAGGGVAASTSIIVEGTGGSIDSSTTAEGTGGSSGSSITVEGTGGSSGTGSPGGFRNLHAAVMLASDVGGPVLFSHKQIAFLVGSFALTCTNHLENVHDTCPLWYLQTDAPLDELVPGKVFPLEAAISEQSEPWGHDGSCVAAPARPTAGTVTIDAVDEQTVSFTLSGTDDDWPLGHQHSDGSYRAPRCDF